MPCAELTLARQLIEQVPDEPHPVFGRAYFAAVLLDWQAEGRPRHWLMRAGQPLRHAVAQQLNSHDWRVRMPVSPRRAPQRPDLASD